MDIRTFYKWTRKKSAEEKLNLLVKQVIYWRDNSANGHEASCHGSRDNAEYYFSEAEHMRERARMLRGMILQEIQGR